jgi:ABC-type Fe3+/spermidine/putrescine transport system ATPase subunit
LPGIKQAGANVFARPEHFKVVPNEHNAVMGEVIKTRFFGSFYETELMLNDQPITMKSSEVIGAEGDLVYVSLDLDRVWYM